MDKYFSWIVNGTLRENTLRELLEGFPRSLAVKNLSAHAGDMGLIPNPERSHMLWNNEARVPQILRLCSRAQEPQL